jgi:glyoxylase-like metal-dependent hydrolase (beta-lactamase superfamily II)
MTNISTTKIIPIKAGVGNCFLVIQNEKFFLVDTGNAGNEDKIISAITSRGLNIGDLQFIFLTHTHYDHAGCASTLKKVTGTKIIVQSSEVEYLTSGFHPIPKGTSPIYKLAILLGKIGEKSRTKFKAVEPDITFTDELDLTNLGINARIIHTPGHTKGSSCLFIDEYALVGDTMFNVMGQIYPPFANNVQQVINSWKSIRNIDVDFYYPAHGKRISKAKFEKAMVKLI